MNCFQRFHNLLLFVFSILSLSPCFAGNYSGGNGSPDNPFQIATTEDLNDIDNHPNDWSKHFMLTNDIDLAAYTYNMAVIAPDVDPPRAFDGTFNGNYYSIRNLSIDTEGENNNALGLFGLVNNAEIKNLTLENINIRGGVDSKYVGSLLGFSIDCSIRNCHVNGNINLCKSYIGILTGLCSGIQIQNCSAVGNITSAEMSWYIGGLAGKCDSDSSIQNSYTEVSIVADNTSSAGGFIGSIHDVNIIDCYSTGIVNANSNAGGLVGHNASSNISDCFSHCSVYVKDEVAGGLVGLNKADITSCFATGDVIGSGA
ncbi:MAG: GLUG motif-containing protein, partial [Planctomycetota bacterium]